MPNWCSTYITVKSEWNNLMVLEKELTEATKKEFIKTDFGNRWLGNLLLHIGMTKSYIDSGDCHCRGEINHFLLDENEICIQIESAWVPHIKCVEMFCKHFDPECKITYIAEEEGSGIYWTNDPDIAGKYRIDSYDDGDMPGEFKELASWESWEVTESDIVDELQAALGVDGNIDKLIAEMDNRLDDTNSFIGLRKYIYVPISECC